METKFTRGPWKINQVLGTSQKRLSIDDDNDNNIADVWALNDITSEEMRANSNLIAAAPEMFESLIDLLERVKLDMGPDNPRALRAEKIINKVLGLSK